MKTPKPLRIASVIAALAFIGCEKYDEQQKTTSTTTDQQDLASDVAELTEAAKEPSTGKLEAPEEGYFKAYLLVCEAEKNSDKEQSILSFQKALASFQSVKNRYPEWKTNMVDNRIELTKQSLAKLQQ